MGSHNVIKGKKLYRILFFGVIFTVVAVGALAFWGVREVRHDAAVVAVENSARGLAGAVTVLINAVSATDEEIERNSLPGLSPKLLRTSFATAFRDHQGLVSVMVSDEHGLRYALMRRIDGLVQGVPDEKDGSGLVWSFYGTDGSVKPYSLERSFDQIAANRVLAEEFSHLKPGLVNWRSAYKFQNLGESWITASSLVETDGKNVMVSYLFPVDVFVSRLGGAEKGSAEKIFLYWGSGKVLPVKGMGTDLSGSDGVEPVNPDKIVDPVIGSASKTLADKKVKVGEPFRYTVNGAVWWGYAYPLSIFGDTMSLGVAVPHRNIVSMLTSDTFLQVFGGILVVFAGLALYVLHRNRARIEALGMRQKAARTAEDVLRLIAEGESRSLEFKQTLRFNLKSGKNGREIEHACLKTVAGFLNSDGGTLLIGVADNGAVTGFEEDNFGSDDKALLHFNNLINQQIGAEFARYLDTAVIETQGRRVLRAYCVPASVPAILKNGQVEEFYIRSGPASRQLSLSQFYEWLKKH